MNPLVYVGAAGAALFLLTRGREDDTTPAWGSGSDDGYGDDSYGDGGGWGGEPGISDNEGGGGGVDDFLGGIFGGGGGGLNPFGRGGDSDSDGMVITQEMRDAANEAYLQRLEDTWAEQQTVGADIDLEGLLDADGRITEGFIAAWPYYVYHQRAVRGLLSSTQSPDSVNFRLGWYYKDLPYGWVPGRTSQGANNVGEQLYATEIAGGPMAYYQNSAGQFFFAPPQDQVTQMRLTRAPSQSGVG